jgi:1-acyl-sn-glycerol-3-phosphate acyltransferase
VLYAVAHWLLRRWARWRFALEVVGLENVPPSGPVVLVANHPSALDAVVVTAALPRRAGSFNRLANVAKLRVRWHPRTLFVVNVAEGRPAGSLAWNGRAMAEALAMLERGWLFLSFPEGDVGDPGEPGSFAPGFVFLAWRSGAPIVPVAVWGSDAAFDDPRRPRRIDWVLPRRAAVRVRFLEPRRLELAPSSRAALESCAEEVRGAIRAALAGEAPPRLTAVSRRSVR